MGIVRSLDKALTGTQSNVPAGEPILRASELRLLFGALVAVDGVSFEIAQGELFALIGPNGAGKTSIINLLSGAYRPTSGSVEFEGQDVTWERPHRIAAMGMTRMFQNVELFENLTVLDNIMLGRHTQVGYGLFSAMFRAGRWREEYAHRQIVEEIIDFLEIEQWRKHPVGLLPYGVKKRVELGRALATEPKLLLLDEPVAGMNVEETEDMARFILDVREELGTSLLLVEHDMGVVMDLADRVMVLDFGKTIATDTPNKVQRDPAVIRAYLGDEDGEDDEGVGTADRPVTEGPGPEERS